MRTDVTHDDPREFESYMRGYMSKRRSDCRGDPVRGDDGSVTYDLRLGSLPAWLTRLLGTELRYTETVQVVSGVAVVRAHCPDADVRVTMQIAGRPAGGTRVDCVVELTPSFRGVPIPQGLLRAFVRNRFQAERARDAQFTDAVLAGGGGEAPRAPVGPAPGPGARRATTAES